MGSLFKTTQDKKESIISCLTATRRLIHWQIYELPQEMSIMEKMPLTLEQFAHLGGGAIAYVRQMRSEEIQKFFPQAPEIGPGVILFALLGADGSPIMVSDSRDIALASALENKLQTVSLH